MLIKLKYKFVAGRSLHLEHGLMRARIAAVIVRNLHETIGLDAGQNLLGLGNQIVLEVQNPGNLMTAHRSTQQSSTLVIQGRMIARNRWLALPVIAREIFKWFGAGAGQAPQFLKRHGLPECQRLDTLLLEVIDEASGTGNGGYAEVFPLTQRNPDETRSVFDGRCG